MGNLNLERNGLSQTFKYQIYCPDFEYEIGLFDIMSIYLIENFVDGNHILNNQLFIILFCILIL